MMTGGDTNNPKIPCRNCAKNIHHKDKAAQCDLCEHWIHIKCNNLNYLDYKYLQTCNEPWYCIECCGKIVAAGFSLLTPYHAIKTS